MPGQFREEDHPRADDGKFGSGGGSATGGPTDEKGNQLLKPGLDEETKKAIGEKFKRHLLRKKKQ